MKKNVLAVLLSFSLLLLFSFKVAAPTRLQASTVAQVAAAEEKDYAKILIDFLNLFLRGLGGGPGEEGPYPTDFPYPTDGGPLPTKGSPLPTLSPIPPGPGDYTVRNLVNKIRSYCEYGDIRGRVTQKNTICIDNIRPALSLSLRTSLKILAGKCYSYDFKCLQCVGFVRSVAIAKGGHLDNGGDAIKFATNVPSGYRFIRKGYGIIKVGALPIWDKGPYGHIAWVVQVFDNYGKRLKIAEANNDGNGTVQERNITINDPGIIGWITKK